MNFFAIVSAFIIGGTVGYFYCGLTTGAKNENLDQETTSEDINIIARCDKRIKEYEKTIEKYKRIIENDNKNIQYLRTLFMKACKMGNIDPLRVDICEETDKADKEATK